MLCGGCDNMPSDPARGKHAGLDSLIIGLRAAGCKDDFPVRRADGGRDGVTARASSSAASRPILCRLDGLP